MKLNFRQAIESDISSLVNLLADDDVAVVLLDETEQPKHHQTRFTAAY